MNRIIIATLAVLILGGIGIYVFLNNSSTTPITISCVKCSKVSIQQEGKQREDVALNTPLQLKKDTFYTAFYTASGNYSDGQMVFSTSDTSKVDITPSYSAKKDEVFVKDNENTLISSIEKDFPAANNYPTRTVKSIGDKQWAVVQLDYKTGKVTLDDTKNTGIDVNGDPLRILFKNQNGKYIRVSDPQIIFTTFNTPDVPLDILKEANNL